MERTLLNINAESSMILSSNANIWKLSSLRKIKMGVVLRRLLIPCIMSTGHGHKSTEDSPSNSTWNSKKVVCTEVHLREIMRKIVNEKELRIHNDKSNPYTSSNAG